MNYDIFEAAESGNDQKMDFILECNTTDINSIDSEGKTPLYLAAENDHHDVVRLLLMQQVIDVNKGIETGPISGQTALFIASSLNHNKIIKLLINHPQVNVNKGMICVRVNFLFFHAFHFGFEIIVNLP